MNNFDIFMKGITRFGPIELCNNKDVQVIDSEHYDCYGYNAVWLSSNVNRSRFYQACTWYSLLDVDLHLYSFEIQSKFGDLGYNL